MLVPSASSNAPGLVVSAPASRAAHDGYKSTPAPAFVSNPFEKALPSTYELAQAPTSRPDDARCQLERHLQLEMEKPRPDHFVIGVTCRALGGVPSALRAHVWKELLGVAQREDVALLDHRILQVEQDLANQRVIAADAARTRSTEPRFQQPETMALVSKLLTYYCKCRTIQYKQGMNEVLAPFLLLTEARAGSNGRVALSEGVVYQCFAALIDKFLPHVFPDKEFRSLQCSFQLYRLLLLYHDPSLCHYLEAHHMTPELYVTPWFMTLFARSVPPDFVFSLWDFFLLEEDPYLLHFVAYALVAAHRTQILCAEIALLPQVLSSLTFASREELERVCVTALAISEATPRSFKRDLYSVCYGGFTDAMVPFLDQLSASSSLQVYPDELIQNLLDRFTTKSRKRGSSGSPLTAPSSPDEQTDSKENPLYSSDTPKPRIRFHATDDAVDGSRVFYQKVTQKLQTHPPAPILRAWLDYELVQVDISRPEALEVVWRCILEAGAATFTHMRLLLEKYGPVLAQLMENDGDLVLVKTVAHVWLKSP
ncbi:hypothetical protein PsorP6_014052 [Peronosclerospora sorghi]|uniref:Uncharacterized protein n=1 Tax=Peronosclerospora sorghi TaxID=230839 RepID=A0ACC0VJB7_9STRA|nr:hypothetical protein PsorP6_014052 [Peronosclerospora sorghi]